MGRIKTLQVKRISHELMRLHADKFTHNYEQNKYIVNRLVSTPSKKLRNIITVITGYVTRLFKQSKEPKKSYTGLREDIEKFYTTKFHLS